MYMREYGVWAYSCLPGRVAVGGGDRRAVGPDNTYEFHFRVVLKGSREASRKALRMAFFSGEGGASSPDPP